MDERDFIRSVAMVWCHVDGSGVGELFSNPSSLVPSDEFRNATLSADTRYEELYLIGLRNRDYNVLLSDFSYFQFSHFFEGLRAAYYPNPFFGGSIEAMNELGEKHEYVQQGLIDFETFLEEISEVRAIESPPLIRYEFDPNGYVELEHPASHFHIGHHRNNRWPAERVITPESFGMIILKLYYSDAWRNAGPQQYGDGTAPLDEIYETARQECRLLPIHIYSDRERNQFRFA